MSRDVDRVLLTAQQAGVFGLEEDGALALPDVLARHGRLEADEPSTIALERCLGERHLDRRQRVDGLALREHGEAPWLRARREDGAAAVAIVQHNERGEQPHEHHGRKQTHIVHSTR